IYKYLYESDIIEYKGDGGIDHSQVVHMYSSTNLYTAKHGTSPDRFYSYQLLKQYLNWFNNHYTNVTVYTIRIKKM
ncbi:MAG: hypothetical protein PHR20_09430, partial [Bacteroidales bacterium]|nr:hypothetical protein [Bacteroidales bacterium]